MESKTPNPTSLYKPLNIKRNSKKPKNKAANSQTYPTSWAKSYKVSVTQTSPSFFWILINWSRILHAVLSIVSCFQTKIEFSLVVMAKNMHLESEKLNQPMSLLKRKSKETHRKLRKFNVVFLSVDSLLMEKFISLEHSTIKFSSILPLFVFMNKLSISSLALIA